MIDNRDGLFLPLFHLRLLNLLDCRRVRHPCCLDVFDLFWRKKREMGKKEERRRKREQQFQIQQFSHRKLVIAYPAWG